MTAAPLAAPVPPARPVQYPDSDGMPMADNTLQFHWIVVLKENLDALLRGFVAGDLLWYPVEGDNKTRQAPDVLVALDRPKGERGSYRQWEERGQPPQVVFEVLSPGNRLGEMIRKHKFYERFGVEEYYVIDPDNGSILIYLRQDGQFVDVLEVDGFVSPRLGIRFQHEGADLIVYRPDGQRFLTFKELMDKAEAEKQRAEAEKQRADSAEARADSAEARAAALEAKLRALGLDPTA